jgi:hypothetical protein
MVSAFKNRTRCCRDQPSSMASSTAGAGSRKTTPDDGNRLGATVEAASSFMVALNTTLRR